MDQNRFPEDETVLPQEPEEESIPLSFSPSVPVEDSFSPEEAVQPPDAASDGSEPSDIQDEALPLFETVEDFTDLEMTDPQEESRPEAGPAAAAQTSGEEAMQSVPTEEPEEPAPEVPAENAGDLQEEPGKAESLTDQIPDTGADYPSLAAPAFREEIVPDEQAMRFHGMRGHGEEEPSFDMSILNDPEYALPQEEQPQPEAAEDEDSDQEYRDNGQEPVPTQDTPAEGKKAVRHRPVRKGRPKRKRSEWLFGIPQILSTGVWLVLIVAIGVTAGRMLWVCAADVLAFGREDRAVTVTIYESDTMEDITEKLYDGGLIRYKGLFNLYASISHAQEDIQPGIYDLNTLYDYHALVNFMSPRSSREVVDLTIPEGYSCRQIFALLEENRICTAVDIGAYAADGELDDYWFLEGVARGDKYCLEGYLFPDTYQFYKNSTPKEALKRMLDNFDVKFSEEMRGQLEGLNANVTGGGYTVREVTTVASLIEKESAAPAESPRIAGVIYNRLFRWGDTPAYLNIDASIIYALDGKADLTREDLQVDSPYNTYTHIGLPPTPISNPGLASLQAALSPEAHDYYYYVRNPSTGMHQFSTTYEEHSAYVAQFAEAQ